MIAEVKNKIWHFALWTKAYSNLVYNSRQNTMPSLKYPWHKFIALIDLRFLQIKLNEILELTQLESRQTEVKSLRYKNNKYAVSGIDEN